MLSKEVDTARQEIYTALQQRHLQSAFARIHNLSANLQEWSIDAKLKELETSYRYMIQYMIEGVDDPERKQVYNYLINTTYHITDIICDKLLVENSTKQYYITKRKILKSNKTLLQIFDSLDNSVNELSLSELIPDSTSSANKRKEVERIATDFFEYTWCNFPPQADDYATLREALEPHRMPESVSALVTSAMTLSIIHYFDETKIDILIDAYLNNDSAEVQIRALCGILAAILCHHTRLHLYENLYNRISLLFDNTQVQTDTHNILLQLVRSRDTEKISRKMTEELLPKMMKISPSLYKKIKEDDALIDIESLEHNPEWQELMDQTGIADNIIEMNELQMQGADVFMSTFAHLKGFPFFSEISNWFMPFMTNHTAVIESLGSERWSKDFANILHASAFLCNSDKYSLCLSLSQAPASQRQMIAAQFSGENLQMQEEAKAELYRKSRERSNISNRYIQDLYRFIKLNRYRSEFFDIFAIPINKLLETGHIRNIIINNKMLKTLSEYLFKNENYKEAIYILDILSQNNYVDSELFQKYAYCYQSLGNYNEALELYLRADLIKPNHVWTLQHIATCYRNLKKTEMALDYYLRAIQYEPENLSINLNIGHCYLEQKEYNKALNYYFKVDYLDTKGTKARRPIAWCSFLAGKYDQAASWYQKIMDNKPTALDYLNAAHVYWAKGNLQKAIELYLQSIKTDGNNIEKFRQNFTQDISDLISAGIKQDDIPIILDQILYKASEEKVN